MERILYLVIAAILLAGCAISSEQPHLQDVDSLQKSTEAMPPAKPDLKIIIQDELLNEPPENPRFAIAQPPAVDAVEQTIVESIKRQLLRLGYVEAESRDDVNVAVWYSYYSEQTGTRYVGQAADVWGDQLAPVAVSDPISINKSLIDISSIMPVSFKVQIISLQESRFPGQVIPIWQGEWSSSLPGMNMVEFSRETLAQVFEQYRSEQTRNQIAAFRQAREKKLQHAINTYMAMVMYRIQRNWRKPKTNVKGKKCEVKIVQSMVGEIRSHALLACDKDRRFRKSIEKAIKESSPLPMPKEELFDRRELILIFQG
ncbi:MAG: TonB C-terminal domain-containing protein [Gammaproteobacteria bacterium]|nr:TonB C-terminal domain-containing protein [Gammaproteobacteria bacterium]